MSRDEALLDRLSRAIAEPPGRPTLRELLRLRMDVVARSGVHPVRARRRWAWKTLLATGLSIGGIGAGAAVAGATLPAPLRSAAVSIGLPVEDAQLAAARTKAARLRDALARHDAPATASAAAALQGVVSQLSQSDRSKLGTQANDLLTRAASGTPATAPVSPTTSSPTTPPMTPPPSAATPATVEQRHESDAKRPGGDDSHPTSTTAANTDSGTRSAPPTTTQGGDHHDVSDGGGQARSTDQGGDNRGGHGNAGRSD